MHRRRLAHRVTRWSALDQDEVQALLEKLEDRAAALDLSFLRRQLETKVMDVTAMATALAIDYAYTGRLTG